LPFLPACTAGDALRKKGFSACDPNGNGLVSLAEAETFVLKTLLSRYPKTREEGDVGTSLWTTFRYGNSNADTPNAHRQTLRGCRPCQPRRQPCGVTWNDPSALATATTAMCMAGGVCLGAA
jgi:hypothetical protein